MEQNSGTVVICHLTAVQWHTLLMALQYMICNSTNFSPVATANCRPLYSPCWRIKPVLTKHTITFVLVWTVSPHKHVKQGNGHDSNQLKPKPESVVKHTPCNDPCTTPTPPLTYTTTKLPLNRNPGKCLCVEHHHSAERF